MKKIIFIATMLMSIGSFADCLDQEDIDSAKNCLSKESSEAESRLSNTYKRLLSQYEGKDRQDLIKAQRLWVQFKEADCLSAMSSFDDRFWTNLYGWQCSVNKAVEREKELRGRL